MNIITAEVKRNISEKKHKRLNKCIIIVMFVSTELRFYVQLDTK